jgi:beta-mannosidase
LLDLAGLWTLSDDTGTHVVPMAVPGDGISALHAAGVIPDPYWGRNEYDCRWVAERDWVLTRRFSVDRTDLALEIDMLDTVAEVLVNGQSVLKADTMFRRHFAGLSSALRMGENEISIRFASSVRVAAARQAGMPFYIPYAAQNCPIPNGNMLRKPACDFGWDWNIALAPFGIYGDIRLVANDAPLPIRLWVRQTHEAGRVTLHIQGETGHVSETIYCIKVAGVVVNGKTNRNGHLRTKIVVDSPRLWWPAGQGEQVLHDMTIDCGGRIETRRIGFRTLELVTEKDASGLGFKFCVNGHDVFAKGANWIPADALASSITPHDTRDLLQSAVDANMNMIRIWGGGRYEPDWFYDLCDEMGLMVWQDFMFACNLYPSTPDFLREVDAEVRDVAARLHHHACIALWCGDNELIGALTWFEESRTDRDRYLVSYDRLNRTIEAALKATVPEANWWPSSPSPGPLSFGDAWHDDSSGDMHFWSVWHEGKDFDHYRDVKPRFCSEFGFQSYPSMQVIKTFADPADWNIASPVMESHQKNAGGNARIAETMFRYFRFPVDFANFVYLSQVQQGLAIKTAVTHWRSLKPHCMGTLYWQLNDTWPVCSWSSLDHGGNWKLLHHMARQFFAPVIVSVVPTPQGFDLVAVNDTRDVVDLTVTALATGMDGQVRRLAGAVAAVGTDAAVTVMRIPAGDVAADEMLALTWTDGAVHRGGDVFVPHPYKSYPLHPARIAMQVAAVGAAWQITLSAQSLALFVAVEADQPGRFSLNAFTLFPGHDATVVFTPKAGGARPTFTLRDLWSATHSPIPKEA